MASAEFLDCELYLAAEGEARLSVAGRHYSGPPALDGELRSRLRKASLDPVEYGTLLFEALFRTDEAELLAGYHEGLAIAQHDQLSLRFRLHLHPTLPPELHELDWELLYDPQKHIAFGRSREIAFSRYLSVSRSPGTAILERPRILIVLGCPRDLADYGMPELDRERMRLAVEKAMKPLAERVSYEFLEAPATAGAIRDRLLADGFHVLHLQAHGLLPPRSGQAALVLESEDRCARFVKEALVAEIVEGDRHLRLVTLIACHGGAPAQSRPFSGLGPTLVQRGVPAVIAMRREISLEAAVGFTEHLYLNLSRSGQVDSAVNAARQQLHLAECREWGTPMLYMRLREGRLWEATKEEPVPGATEPDSDSGTHEIVDDFLARVERVCRLREKDGVEIERILSPGSAFAYLRVTVQDDGIVRIYPVGALSGRVSVDLLEKFLAVHRRYREADPGVISTLVCGGPPAPPGLVRRASTERVRLRSFVEYQGLIDFRSYVARQWRKRAEDPRYPPSLYVPQRIRYRTGGEEHEGEALETVTSWLRDEHGRFILILGDFGTGKTFLLHELARRLGEKGAPLVPVLIEMRDLEKGHSLDALVAQHLVRSGMERIDLKAFRYMLEKGRIALLFDGFDELALRVTYERATEHFATLLEASQGQEAKVIVTSRTQHFESDQQVKTALGERIDLLAGRRIARLQRFDARQVRCFLVNRLGDEASADERLALLEEVHDLTGLAENPRLLGFIADLDPQDLRSAQRREGGITAAGLYQLLLDRWLGYEYDRHQPRGALAVLTVEQRWDAVTQLALHLWPRSEPTIDVGDLRQEVSRVLKGLVDRNPEVGKDPEPRLSEQVAAHQVGSGTLLVRDGEGAFSFIHQSVLEWLVARQAAQELRHDAASSRILGLRVISALMADFLRDLAGPGRLATWVRKTLSSSSHKVAIQNAFLLMGRLEEALREPFDLTAQDLRGKDFSRQDLSGSDLSRADLSSARLLGTRLEKARLQGTQLSAADLSRADLRSADLRRANLSGARLLGADLRQARLRGSVLRRAKLVGARLDEPSLQHAELYGFAPPRPTRVLPWVASASTCRAAAWSGDDELLVTAHADASLRLWEVETGLQIRRFEGHTDTVLCLAWSRGGETLASGSKDRTVRLWDVASDEAPRVFCGHELAVTSLAWDGSGQRLASGSKDGKVRIWDVVSGEVKATLGQAEAAVTSLAWSGNGGVLASGSETGHIRLWDVASGEPTSGEPTSGEPRVLGAHTQAVTSLVWSPDGDLLGSGSRDRTVRLWDVANTAPFRTLEGHRGSIMSVAWSPQGRTLASGSADRTVQLWDVATGEPSRTLEGHGGAVTSVAWSGDGRTLASGSIDRTVRLWDVAKGESYRTLRDCAGVVVSVACSPAGGSLASGSKTGAVRLWDVKTGESPRLLKGHEDGVLSLAYSGDGRRLASGSFDRTVRIWDVAAGETSGTLEGHSGAVGTVAWSGDAARLASGCSDCKVRIWDPASRELLRTLEGHTQAVASVAWSGDGRCLVSGSFDRTLRLWNGEDREPYKVLRGHSEAVLSVAWSDDAEILASGSQDKTVWLWNATSGEKLRRLEGHGGAILNVAYSPDQRSLASAGDDRTIRLWDVETGACRARLDGHGDTVVRVAWSADGRHLYSGSSDNTIRVWELPGGLCLVVLVHLPEGWVAFAPNDRLRSGRYKLGGETAGEFWHSIGLCRFEPGELDPYLGEPLRVAAGEPLVPELSKSK